MKLYELTREYQELADIEINDDADEQAFIDLVTGLKGELIEKIDGCVKVMAAYSGESEALEYEIKRLKARQKAVDNRQEGLSKYILDNMRATNNEHIKTETHIIYITTTKAVSIDNEAKLPDEYVHVKTERVPVKADIRVAIEAGKDVPGASLVTNYNLRVK